MYNGRKIICLIPARGGSKGISRKNIMKLEDKPLIAWTIQSAKQSNVLDKIFVSTDDEEIAEISKKWGAEVPFLRPKELALDTSPTIDTIFHTIDYFEKQGINFDYLVLLEPTSPLRKKDDIDNAIKRLVDNSHRTESLVSVGEIHMESPFIAKIVEGDFVKALLNKDSTRFYQRQQIPKTFFPYGVIYAATVKSLKNFKTFYQETTISYYIERWQNFEIDDIFDFYCIEAMMKQKRKDIE